MLASLNGLYGLKVLTPPAVEPVGASELRSHLRLDTQADDDNITAIALAARRYIEGYCNRQLITCTYQYVQDSFYGFDMPGGQILLGNRPVPQNRGGGFGPWTGPIYAPRAPLQSVTSINYVEPAAGATLLLDPSQYQVANAREPGRIVPAFGLVWPVTREVPDAVTIVFVAGYGDDEEDVPEELRLAIKLLTAHWYFNRVAVTEDLRKMPLPYALECLLGLYDLNVY